MKCELENWKFSGFVTVAGSDCKRAKEILWLYGCDFTTEQSEENAILTFSFSGEETRCFHFLECLIGNLPHIIKGEIIYQHEGTDRRTIWRIKGGASHFLDASYQSASKKTMTRKELYRKAKKALPPDQIDHHESDLYLKNTATTSRLIDQYDFKDQVVLFRSQIDNSWWYDIPFANIAFWDAEGMA